MASDDVLNDFYADEIARLTAEIARLTAEMECRNELSSRINALTAENARLREAGSVLADSAVFASQQFDAIGSWACERLSGDQRRELTAQVIRLATHGGGAVKRWRAALAAAGGEGQERPAPELFDCTRCGNPITDGYMIGDGDGHGRRFTHPECVRQYPGAYKTRAAQD